MNTKEKVTSIKVKVLIPFRDKTDATVTFEVGQELDFEKERADDVVTRGLAEYVLPVG